MFLTRLDTVVKVKERDEEKAAQALSRAQVAVQKAQEKVDEAHRRAMADFRARHDVAQWEVHELATARALVERHRASEELHRARSGADQARQAYAVANRNAEVVRRVADARRGEARAEVDRLEARALDEAALFGFIRKAG